MTEYRIVLPLRAPLMTQNKQRGAHWTTVRGAKDDLEWLVVFGARKAKVPKIDGPVSARLVWYTPDAKPRDTDGIAPMMKGCLDALVKLGIIEDDNSKIVVESCLGPFIVSRDNPRFELIIKQLEA